MKPSRNWIVLLTLVAVVAALAAPTILYAIRFGGHLSSEHVRWSEFGAYVGGIYAPIAAFITLLIVSRQLSSQVEFNKHQIDQSFLANARADLHYYVEQLRQISSKNEQLANVPLGHVLVTMFSSKSHSELREAIHTTNVRRISMTDDRVVALWGAVYTVFRGLRAVSETDCELVYSSSKQKCIATLGYALCDALDNLHYVAARYPDAFQYEFHAGARPEC